MNEGQDPYGPVPGRDEHVTLHSGTRGPAQEACATPSWTASCVLSHGGPASVSLPCLDVASQAIPGALGLCSVGTSESA